MSHRGITCEITERQPELGIRATHRATDQRAGPTDVERAEGTEGQAAAPVDSADTTASQISHVI